MTGKAPPRDGWRQWKRAVKGRVKGLLRRQTEALLPSREAREYALWLEQRLAARRTAYARSAAPGLFSILTPVWNGSPAGYLRALAESIARQNEDDASEWVLLDNGCTADALRPLLQELSARKYVKMIRSERNVGIIAGMRRCLEEASGQYVLPVDADDLLFDDALGIAAAWVERAGFPKLLYSDEDKIIGKRHYQPYFKPGWDPVLLLNSAYIAHLGIMHRGTALQLGVYGDTGTEGSPDWDAFLRFFAAGHTAVHVPELIYSWRVHAASTADDAATKPYVQRSQQAVLERYLGTRDDGASFEVEQNARFAGGGHWRLLKPGATLGSFVTVAGNASLPEVARAAQTAAFVIFLGSDVEPDGEDWRGEAASVFDLHKDAVMVGGCIRDANGYVRDGGWVFGFGRVCGSPFRGVKVTEPGYFGQLWKERSVSAVSTQFAVAKSSFVLEALATIPAQSSAAFFGAWAGAHAWRRARRVVYSPFLTAASSTDWDALVSEEERLRFAEANRDLLPDSRFYSPSLSFERAFAPGDAAAITAPPATGSG